MIELPEGPLDLEQVAARWPTVRQSLAREFDDCALAAYFAMRYAQGWSTSPAARGTIFHRTAAEILRTMQRNNSRTIPISEALAILMHVCRQEDVPAEEIVRVPIHQLPELRMAVRKFAADNEFTTAKIVDVERRLDAPLRYPHPAGGHVERILSGQLDVLLFNPPDEAIVIDWKDTWGLPPQPVDDEPQGYDDEELGGLSFHGYFQQRWYGFLILSNYRNVNKVTLREFYPRFTQVRRATLHRHQLPDVEEELGVLVGAFDRALGSGPPNLSPGLDGTVDIDAMGEWKPSPGRHCGFCTLPTSCPIPEPVRIAGGGAVTSQAAAERWAARWQVAEQIRKIARESLKLYVETSGEPVPIRDAKGRRVIGWSRDKAGRRRFGFYTPDRSDRGGHADYDRELAAAMRDATARARAERGVRRRGIRARS